MSVKFDIHAFREAILAGLQRVALTVEARAKEVVPVLSGNLQRSILSDINETDYTATVVASAYYALWVHQGTGLYGPYNALITPKFRQALHWGGSMSVFAKSTKGQVGQPFLDTALKGTDIIKEFMAGSGFEGGGL
jgi:hypothetical protein